MSRNAPLNATICAWLALFPVFGSLAATGPEPARVVVVQDPEAVTAFRARSPVVRRMVDRAITNWTHTASVSNAWSQLVSPKDTVGIKVYSLPGPNSGTRPAVVAAVVEGLIAAGVPAKQIIVWDKETIDLRLAGFFDLAEKYGVRVGGSADAGYDEKTFYDSAIIGNLVWGDLEFGKKGPGVGRKSFVSKIVARDMTKIITVTPLLNHNLTRITGALYSLAMGSVDNVNRFEADPERLATAVPEIYALPALSDHVVLNIVDALICQYEGGERGLLHYSATLNQIWVSKDPVAVDVLGIRELERQRNAAEAPPIKGSVDLYSNAALLELGVNDLKKIIVENLR